MSGGISLPGTRSLFFFYPLFHERCEKDHDSGSFCKASSPFFFFWLVTRCF